MDEEASLFSREDEEVLTRRDLQRIAAMQSSARMQGEQLMSMVLEDVEARGVKSVTRDLAARKAAEEGIYTPFNSAFVLTSEDLKNGMHFIGPQGQRLGRDNPAPYDEQRSQAYKRRI